MKIKVRVKPNSGSQEINIVEGNYVVKLKSSAEEGKANIELINLLRKHFNKSIKIKSGLKSRNKIVEVEG